MQRNTSVGWQTLKELHSDFGLHSKRYMLTVHTVIHYTRGDSLYNIHVQALRKVNTQQSRLKRYKISH